MYVEKVSMRLKKIYTLLTSVFSLLTIYEVIIYILGKSNYFGLFYIALNLFILFLMFMVSINIKKGNTMIRISKNAIIVILGLLSSFVLKYILSSVFGYVDESDVYINKIFISLKIVKPIIYIVIGALSYLEYKNMKI